MNIFRYTAKNMRVKNFFNRHKENELPYEKFVKKNFFRMIVVLILIIIVSYVINPNAYIKVWQNWFYLFGSALGFVISTLGLISIFWPAEKEKEIRKESIRLINIETEHAIRGLEPKLFGLTELIEREETQEIWNQCFKKKALLLSGEAGSGKSGIGVEIYKKCKEQEVLVFVLDVRRFSGIKSKNEISEKIGLKENIITVFSGFGKEVKCLLIIDQLDSVCGTPLGNIFVEFAIECRISLQLSVLVISRHNEIERNLLRDLLESDFAEIKIEKINEELVRETLLIQGLENPSSELIRLCANVLLLDLVCSIILDINFISAEGIENETNVWNKYLDLYLKRESKDTGFSEREIYHGLDEMARMGLMSEDRSFTLEFPLTSIQKRYLSQGIISKSSHLNQRYYFKVEKFQDFLYVFSATNKNLLKSQVEKEINIIFHKNIFSLMVEFYKFGNPEIYELFLNEVLSG